MLQTVVRRLYIHIFDRGLDIEICPVQLRLADTCRASSAVVIVQDELRMDECSERSDMDFRRLVQPYMAVDSRSFVEPSLLEGRIRTDAYKVLAPVIQVLRDVVCLSRISAWLMTEIESVDPYARVAEYSVELEPYVLSKVLCRHCECLSVPTYAGLGILESDGLVTVAVAGFGCIWQVHDPVMRQIHHSPSRSVELWGVRAFVMDRSRLRQVVEILCSASEILRRRRCIAECELPSLVKIQPLALVLRLGTYKCKGT